MPSLADQPKKRKRLTLREFTKRHLGEEETSIPFSPGENVYAAHVAQAMAKLEG